MDSGKSGSLNSSSGGDDDQYDSSRNESLSAFFNSSNQQPPPPLPPLDHHHQQRPSNFNPYLHPLSRPPPPPIQAPNSLQHLDMVWPRNNLIIRSQPNCTNSTNDSLMGSISIPSAQPPQHGSAGRIHFPNPSSISLQTPAAHDDENVVIRGSSTSSVQHHHQTCVTTRNGKKRSRASRRAPTTVLTTDTSNFRAMVQEFTGIPPPPFSSSSFPRRSRFHLFNSSSTLMKTGHLETAPPPYLLRPFPHKVHELPSFSTSITTTTTTSTNNYQLPPDHQNLLNMQNPILTFQTLLQQPKGPGSTISSPLKMGALEEFNMSCHVGGHVINSHLGGLSNVVSTSNDMLLRSNIITNNNWGNHHNNNGDNNNHNQQQGHLSSSYNGNCSNPQGVSTSCKMNFATDFHTDRGSTEKVRSTRSEGMLDSWICSSD